MCVNCVIYISSGKRSERRTYYDYAAGGGVETVDGFTVAADISDNLTSIGMRSSYNVGAWRMIPAVPTSTAKVKIQRKSRSNTIATYFQSSFTCD